LVVPTYPPPERRTEMLLPAQSYVDDAVHEMESMDEVLADVADMEVAGPRAICLGLSAITNAVLALTSQLEDVKEELRSYRRSG
jgi:hypothetical protein